MTGGYHYQGGRSGMSGEDVAARVAAAKARVRASITFQGQPQDGTPDPAGEPEPGAAIAAIKARAQALIRCDVCRYLLARCCCPGGPRGGAA